MRMTINSGTTFLLGDDLGNILSGAEMGLYHEDTRYLSTFELTIDGRAPLVLAAHPTEAGASAHFLTNPVLPAVPRGQLSIIRRRELGEGMREELAITNHSEREVAFTLQLRLEADFCHVFEAKHEVEVEKDLSMPRDAYRHEISPDGREHGFFYAHGPRVRTLLVLLSEPPVTADPAENRLSYPLRLAAQQEWRLVLDFLTFEGPPPAALEREEQTIPKSDEWGVSSPRRGRSRSHDHYRRHHEQLLRGAPTLETDSYTLRRAYLQSVRDFAALQIVPPRPYNAHHETAEESDEFTIAAGIPWFMTLFGRDSLLTAYQALPFFPLAARGTLRALARLQGTQVDRLRAEEPGKILHEHRSPAFNGAQTGPSIFPYYGTIDATPLFLQLLADVSRVTGDLELARELCPNALAALDWMRAYGDRDGDGYIEYYRDADAGLENQGWKDSGDSLRFRDGRLARGPIALCEVQGYAYAARMGMADVFDALGESEHVEVLRAEAAALKARFNRDFWMEERGYYALALDGEKRQVDALTSNAGQVLWTGIADAEKAHAVATHLVSPAFFSGWGVRTMATSEGAYNPISYHNGSVWPHDTSLIVAGLARYGFVEEAARIAGGMLAALDYAHDARLPELFAGYSVSEAPFPVEYPTACRPQAWAAGSIFLLLATMTATDVGVRAGANLTFLPETVDHVRLHGVWVDGRRTDTQARQEREREQVGAVAAVAHIVTHQP